MIFSGPVEPQEVYGDTCPLHDIALLGDDLQGYCLGYDFSARTYGEVGPTGAWQPWPSDVGLAHFIEA
jgi:hypothetical protein